MARISCVGSKLTGLAQRQYPSNAYFDAPSFDGDAASECLVMQLSKHRLHAAGDDDMSYHSM